MVQGHVGTPRAGSRGGLGGSAPGDLGPVAGVTGVGGNDSSAERGKVEPPGRDIERVPGRPRWSDGSAHLVVPETAAAAPAAPAPGGSYLYCLPTRCRESQNGRDHVPRKCSLGVFTERWTPSPT